MTESELRNRVLDQIEGMRDEITATLQTLVRIPSVTPKYPGLDYDEVVGGEKRCNEALVPSLQAAGAEIDLWEEEPGRGNLVGVVKGRGGGRSLICNGHIDTVPEGEASAWTGSDPWSARVADGLLYGLGACDMKAGIVAQTMAAVALKRCGVSLQGDLILESVCGEESMDHNVGVSASIRRGYRADAAIVTEPTAFTGPFAIAPCSAGALRVTVTVPGKATHTCVRGSLIWPGGAGETYGVNAIDKGVFVYQGIRKLEENWGFTKPHPLFPPGHFSLGVNLMVGRSPGPAGPYIVPNECLLDVTVIYRPGDDPAEVKREVEHHLNSVFDQDPWLRKNRPVMEWPHHWPAYNTPIDHPITQSLASAHQTALGVPPFFQGFAAVDDAAYLERGGIPAISFGPGNLMVCHAVDEHVEIEEVVKVCKVLATTAMEWCGV
jgi:acetylornithine deacetylase/succinyl-diaminopimelate desuccinylase family protein